MPIFGISSSREQKNILLEAIIKKLNISEEEKELYLLSVTLLDDTDFNKFYHDIDQQIHSNTHSILPFSPQLI